MGMSRESVPTVSHSILLGKRLKSTYLILKYYLPVNFLLKIVLDSSVLPMVNIISAL